MEYYSKVRMKSDDFQAQTKQIVSLLLKHPKTTKTYTMLMLFHKNYRMKHISMDLVWVYTKDLELTKE